jgi:hypothetical protein
MMTLRNCWDRNWWCSLLLLFCVSISWPYRHSSHQHILHCISEWTLRVWLSLSYVLQEVHIYTALGVDKIAIFFLIGNIFITVGTALHLTTWHKMCDELRLYELVHLSLRGYMNWYSCPSEVTWIGTVVPDTLHELVQLSLRGYMNWYSCPWELTWIGTVVPERLHELVQLSLTHYMNWYSCPWHVTWIGTVVSERLHELVQLSLRGYMNWYSCPWQVTWIGTVVPQRLQNCASWATLLALFLPCSQRGRQNGAS